MPLLGALGCLGLRLGLGLGDAALDGDIESRLAGGAHHQGRAGRHRHRGAGTCKRLLARVQTRQDQRRPAGVGRRRDPGVDPEIGRRHHAAPIEGRGDAFGALAARGKNVAITNTAMSRAARKDRARQPGEPVFRPSARGPHAAHAPDAHARARPRTGHRPRAPCGRRWPLPGGAAASSFDQAVASPRSPTASAPGTAAPSPPPPGRKKPTDRSAGERRQCLPEPEPGQREEQADCGRNRRQRRPKVFPEDRKPRTPQSTREHGFAGAGTAVVVRGFDQRAQSGSRAENLSGSTP